MKNTKQQIIKVAKELFMTRGYDKTSMQCIIDEVGIAKGTLYHHFTSKSDIMNAVLNQTLDCMVIRAKEIVINYELDVVTRLVYLLTKLSPDKEDEFLLEHMHRPENIKLNHYQNRLMYQRVSPILGNLIKEGVDQGIFDVQLPYHTAELIVIYITEIFDYNLELTKEEFKIKLSAFIIILERLLGTKKGTFDILNQDLRSE